MVRSNFDYTNRPSSGEKLGASIASDFWKKATQHVKTKTGSRKSSGEQGVTAAECNVAQTRFDIKIPHKLLTDAGFQPTAEALVTTLSSRPDLILTDLDLSGNQLTTASLMGLTRIIENASDLVNLNLSNNSISVSAPDQASAMDLFARAFWESPSLRKIDLSGNKCMAGRTIEILAHAYSIIAPLDNATSPRRDSHSGDRDRDGKAASNDNGTISGPPSPSRSGNRRPKRNADVTTAASPGSAQVSGKALDLSNTDMEEHGALFAAAMIFSRTAGLQQITVSFDHNEGTLSKDAQHLLQIARKAGPARSVSVSTKTKSASPDDELLLADDVDGDSPQDAPALSNTKNGTDHTDYTLAMERAVKKVQRNIIVKHGHSSVALWAAALRAFACSRQVYALAKPPPQSTTEVLHPATPSPIEQICRPMQTKLALGLPKNDSQFANSTGPAARTARNERARSYAETITRPGDPGPRVLWADRPAALTLDAYMRLTKKENSRPMLSNDKMAEMLYTGQPGNGHAPSTNGHQEESAGIEEPENRYLLWQRIHSRSCQQVQGGASNGYRDTSLRCQLPLPICQNLLRLMMTEEDMSLLSNRHQRKAFEWGQLRDSLATEYDWRNRDKASQVWMLLEAADCLEYD